MEIHPELARLRGAYDQIVADYTAGHYSDEQARGTLQAMRVWDASGAVWGIDLDGRFVRQRTPFEAPEHTPPALFALVSIGGEPEPGSTIWGQNPSESGILGPVVDPGPAPPSLVARGGDLLRQRLQRKPRLAHDPFDLNAKQRRIKRVAHDPFGHHSRKRLSGTHFGGFGELFNKHRTTFIVGGAVVALLVIVNITKSETTPSADSTSVTPTVASTAPSTTPSTVASTVAPPVVSTLPATTTTTAPVIVAPTPERVAAVFALLNGTTSALSAVGAPIDGRYLAVQVAFWNGLQAAGFTPVFSPAVLDGPLSASSSVDIRTTADGHTVFSMKLIWQQPVGGEWVLSLWPDLVSTE